MRRNFKIRKRKSNIKFVLDIQHIILILILIFLLIICIFLNMLSNKKNNSVLALANYVQEFIELNSNIPFSIEKIILYSNVNADSKIVNLSYADLNISQYSDIGIYLNKPTNNASIKSLYINNISISNPRIGSACLYKKKYTDLGKPSFSENLIISDQIDFNISNNKKTNYDNYEISSDESTPISIGYYNKNIKEDYIVYLDDSEIDGTVLKDALIPLSDLYSSVSFTINIISNNDEHYICNVCFAIPLEDETGNLYNVGSISKEILAKDISKFIRIK